MLPLILMLCLGIESEPVLMWSDSGKAFTVQFNSAIWLFTDKGDSFSLTHQSLEGLELKITVRATDPTDPSLIDLAKETFYRKGERQAAAIATEHELSAGELKSLNATEGYYCEGVYGPDVEPISVWVLVLKRSGRVLIAEGLFPGTEKQNSYSWRKCSEALNTVWQTISGVGKIKK
jgi:hypothetical protein